MATKSRKRDIPLKEIPDQVVNPANGKTYTKGKFLGKGGFARCYELTDDATKQIYAGKVVAKVLLLKPHQKDKMTQEISIHRSLSHRSIVRFHCFFEDVDNVYILLELCRRRSMMELSKRRKSITEPEARYFIRQVSEACLYLHRTKVIHRDLKLGNLFINDEMEIKIGDFGLATKLDFDGERKKTLCGTPNYIAPEVLGKQGHSYEVDSWSLGCILYTLLVGKPPFETRSLEDTYVKIKKNEYHIPSRVSVAARNLITKLLRPVPSERPNMSQVLSDPFFTAGIMPTHLPTSCLQMAPRLDTLIIKPERKPLTECNGLKVQNTANDVKNTAQAVEKGDKPDTNTVQRPSTALVPDAHHKVNDVNEPTDYWLSDLYSQLTAVVASKPVDKNNPNNLDLEDPASIPIYWVCKWVDYSDKYGIGYQLIDNSFGVLFNDSTRLLLLDNEENMQYIERDGAEHYYTMTNYPPQMTKKCTLLKYFRSYMTEHLLKAGGNVTPRETDKLVRLPFLRAWFRTRSAMVLHLSNGTLQVNFFEDHTKVICCPLMAAVTYIDSRREVKTYPFASIDKYGCSRELSRRLEYTCSMLERLMSSKSSGRVKPSVAS